jgi:amino acid permease
VRVIVLAAVVQFKLIGNQPVDMSKGFGFVIAVTFTLNYIIGTGFLTLPWAYFASGDGLATAVLLFITLLAVCSALMILEAMARGAVMTSGSHKNRTQVAFKNYSAIPLTDNELKVEHSNDKDSGMWQVGERRIEIVELCEIFYPAGRPYFIFILSVYMYGALWAYCTVFANALATTAPILGDESYYFYLVVYAFVVVPMSCLELSEQVTIQIFYAICRVVMVLSMLGTVAYAVYETGSNYDESANNPSELVKWDGFKVIVPIALYANIFHHSLPALSEIVADKKQLGMVYISTLFICFGAYTMIGVTLSTYFGTNILSSSNLNWADFYHKHQSLVVAVISDYIILFPAVDVMSAFPLSAITLGNNLHSFLTTEKLAGPGPSLINRRELIMHRCLASIPPVLGACFIKDLGIITKYTGITGFAIIFFYPVILSYQSNHQMEARGLNPCTYYTCVMTSGPCKVLLLAFGTFMVLLTLFT